MNQYKEEYDKDNKLRQIVLNSKNEKIDIKFIIMSSINDNSLKKDLNTDLIYIFNKNKNLIRNDDVIKIEKYIEYKSFDECDFIHLTHIENKNVGFSNISIFNEVNLSEVENKNIDNDEKYVKFFNEPDNELQDVTKIIYINNLISIKEIINDPIYFDFFELFSYNPKVYSNYNDLLE